MNVKTVFLESRVYQAMQSHEQEYTTFKLHTVPNQSVLNEALVIQELPVGNGALDTGYEYVTAAEGYSTVCVYILVHHLIRIKLLQTIHSFFEGSWISLGTRLPGTETICGYIISWYKSCGHFELPQDLISWG